MCESYFHTHFAPQVGESVIWAAICPVKMQNCVRIACKMRVDSQNASVLPTQNAIKGYIRIKMQFSVKLALKMQIAVILSQVSYFWLYIIIWLFICGCLYTKCKFPCQINTKSSKMTSLRSYFSS